MGAGPASARPFPTHRARPLSWAVPSPAPQSRGCRAVRRRHPGPPRAPARQARRPAPLRCEPRSSDGRPGIDRRPRRLEPMRSTLAEAATPRRARGRLRARPQRAPMPPCPRFASSAGTAPEAMSPRRASGRLVTTRAARQRRAVPRDPAHQWSEPPRCPARPTRIPSRSPLPGGGHSSEVGPSARLRQSSARPRSAAPDGRGPTDPGRRAARPRDSRRYLPPAGTPRPQAVEPDPARSPSWEPRRPALRRSRSTAAPWPVGVEADRPRGQRPGLSQPR
jgi:hypothetical protein